ncbi:MAG: GTP-binding protein [Promethearchaeota archaeon]
MPKPIVLKVITAGEGGVGKTTLLHRYVEGKFLADTKLTIGVQFFLKELKFNGRRVSLQLWDFGGQERFRFLLKNYAVGAKGALLMFDLTRPLTLKNLDQWVEICRAENPELPIIFLGTKLDLSNLIIVKDEFALTYKKKYSLFDYLKVSSKTGENVDLAFALLAKEIMKVI